MGFVSGVLSAEKDIQIYYIIGILIFVGLFIVILIKTVNMRKTDILEYKTSILDIEETDSN